MYDLIIRGGTVVDGTGSPPFVADIAVKDGYIVEIGKIFAPAAEVIAATDLIVTPGWVDIHTHYDAQVTWDDRLTPSFWHGVTTVVMGNCGVGFAPVRPSAREWLIDLMEGVEDIPGTALASGIQWEWETFPEYLDAIDRKPLAIDVAAQVPHGPLRTYVMGERGVWNDPATPEEIAEMARLVSEAQAAGAIGFSTSRTVVHRATSGHPVPGTFAEYEELYALANAVASSGHGVMEIAPAGLLGEDAINPPRELAWMNRLAAETGCPITFLSGQNHIQPEWWHEQLANAKRQHSLGAKVIPQFFCRSIGIMAGLRSKLHPFCASPTLLAMRDLPYDQLVRRLSADAELRRRVADEGVDDILGGTMGYKQWDGVYALGRPADYEPEPSDSVQAIAERRGMTPREIALGILLEEDGNGFLHRPIMGYADGNLDSTHAMLASGLTIPGGSDAGAHVTVICDASAPTFMLTHWVRDRNRGPRLQLEHIVRRQTWDVAQLYGLNDRGRLAPGLRADINVIDFDRLECGELEIVHDLPTGAQRLMQKAKGYCATIVAGQRIIENGEDTGRRPGHLVRSGRARASRGAF